MKPVGRAEGTCRSTTEARFFFSFFWVVWVAEAVTHGVLEIHASTQAPLPANPQRSYSRNQWSISLLKEKGERSTILNGLTFVFECAGFSERGRAAVSYRATCSFTAQPRGRERKVELKQEARAVTETANNLLNYNNNNKSVKNDKSFERFFSDVSKIGWGHFWRILILLC